MTTIRTLAIALLLAASPTVPLAQTAQQPQGPPAEHGEADALTSETAGRTSTTEPAQPRASKSAATGTEDGVAPHQRLPQAVDGQIVFQDENTFLANELLDLTVYSSYGGAVGDVNDLLIGRDGAVAGVVIGMGGFLGIGEKQVAVEMEMLTVIPVAGGGLLLLLDVKADDLQGAPSFATLDQRRAASQAQDLEKAKASEQQDGLADDATQSAGTTPSEE